MAKTLTLHLVNDLGQDSISGSDSDVPMAWPGTPTVYDFNLTPQLIQPVWIGVSEDGSTNQVYPLTTSVAAILGAGWARVYQGTEIVGQSGDVQVFSEQYLQLLNELAACCGTALITALFALKNSNYSLNPLDPNPPCGTEALFKWLAVFGTNEERELTYQFIFSLLPADGDLDKVFSKVLASDLPFTETTQLIRGWPADFIGMVSQQSKTLVANDAVAGSGNVRVSEYDGGTISVNVVMSENDDQVDQRDNAFRLPATDCAPGCSTVHWNHVDNVFGLLAITVNGDPVVSSDTDEEGNFTVNNGDVVSATVTGGDAMNRLIVSEATDGNLFDTNDTENPVTFEFTAACAKAYTIEARTQGGE